MKSIDDPCITSAPTAQSIYFSGVYLNLSAISRATGIDRSYLSRVFAGKLSPNLFFAEKVSDALGFTLDRFTSALKVHCGDRVNPKSRASVKNFNKLTA